MADISDIIEPEVSEAELEDVVGGHVQSASVGCCASGCQT